MKNSLFVLISIVLLTCFKLTECQLECLYEVDIDYIGNDIYSTPNYTASFETCCNSCNALSNCQIVIVFI
jgi:hypothetical protein